MGENMDYQLIRSEKSMKDQRVKRTYRELIKALEQLLGEMTLEQMTVKQICETAHIQRTTFYQHFRDMEDFLDWYILQKQEEFRSCTARNIIAIEARDAFIELSQSIMNYVTKNEKLVKSVMNTQINGKPLFDLYVSTCVEELMERLKNVPELERRAGDTPIIFLAEFYVGGMIAAFRWWIVNNKPVSGDEFMNYLRLRVEKTVKI